jgi:dimethylaniline monooxygenase (N-oxide forming)
LARLLADTAVRYLGRRTFGKLDPAWRLEPFPSLTLNLPGSWEDVVPLLKSGVVTSMHGIKRFTGPRAIEFGDGTVLDDVDVVICATGYKADFTLTPFLETSMPNAYGYRGEPLYRLYMNTFPPRYADSCVLLCYSAFGKSNGFSFADVTAMAVSNVWRGEERLPTLVEMEHHIDAHQAWVASRWRMEPQIDPSMVKQWEFQGWLHRAAGTGMENLGWGWQGWKFWFKDRKMYSLMNNGVETAHMYRFFETGKRRTWEGAREAILHMNELVKMFPIKEDAGK